MLVATIAAAKGRQQDCAPSVHMYKVGLILPLGIGPRSIGKSGEWSTFAEGRTGR
jgi:hypothetical protein